MKPAYRTVFDLTAHPERIQPPYGFYAIFLLAGVLLVVLAVVSVRFRWRQRKALSIFSAVWVSFCCVMLVIDIRDVAAVRVAAQRGEVTQVEGCLTYFRPGLPYGTKSTIGNEEWSVSGTIFSYGAGEARPGYHIVEPNGGVVHPDNMVRVFFVTSRGYGRNEIVRIDVIDHGCPPARHVEPSTEP